MNLLYVPSSVITLSLETARLDNQRIRKIRGVGTDVYWSGELEKRLRTALGCAGPYQGCDIEVELAEVSSAVTRVRAVVRAYSPQQPGLAAAVASAAAALATSVGGASNTLKLMLFTISANEADPATIQTPVG